MKKFVWPILLLFFINSFAQENLLEELADEVQLDSSATSAFKGLKIVNLESTKLAAKRDLYFVIAHRFGSIKSGLDDLFGLDNSTIRFSFILGLSDWVNMGISRSSFNKVYDGSLKYKLKTQQTNGFPFTVVGYNAMAVNTGWDSDHHSNFESKHRLSYVSQLLISRKFSEALSLQLVPIVLHENYVSDSNQDNTQYLVGAGGRYKLSKFVTLNMDYSYHFNRVDNSVFKNPFSIGVDIETGGHVFQLHLTNAQPMYDAGFLTNASGDWADGDIFFGFNLSRVF
jgi:hypothetical protein